jgi:hypothetical protein
MLTSPAAAYDLTAPEPMTETTAAVIEAPAEIKSEAVEPAAATTTELVETTAQVPAITNSSSTGGIAPSRLQLGSAGLAAAGTGVAIAIGGTIWAMLVDVPAPIAIMAGYCTLAGAVCATAALQMKPAPMPAEVPLVSSGPTTHFEAWRLVKKFSVSDASRLWCDLEPGSTVTQETIAWARVMLDAISRGELAMVERAGARKEAIEHERNNPNWHTEMTREALTAWAKSHGFDPRFLRD